MFKFRNMDNVEDFLLEYLGVEYLLTKSIHSANTLIYFHNGDKLTVYLDTKELEWEPLRPGVMSSSRLSMRIHQWLSKGIIIPIPVE